MLEHSSNDNTVLEEADIQLKRLEKGVATGSLATIASDDAASIVRQQIELLITQAAGDPDVTTSHISTFHADWDALCQSPAPCTTCIEAQPSAMPVARVTDLNATGCGAPLLRVVEEVRERTAFLLVSWGWHVPILGLMNSIEVVRPLDNSGPLISCRSSDRAIIFFNRHQRYDSQQHLVTRFQLFHEWLSHLIPNQQGPAALLDDFCIPWQKQVYLGSIRHRPSEHYAVLRYRTGPVQPGSSERAALALAHVFKTALAELSDGSLATRLAQAWEYVGALTLAALEKWGDETHAQFMVPLGAACRGPYATRLSKGVEEELSIQESIRTWSTRKVGAIVERAYDILEVR